MDAWRGGLGRPKLRRHRPPEGNAVTIRRLSTLSILAALPLALSACDPVGMAIGAGAYAGVAASQERGFQGAVDDTKIAAEVNHMWFQHDHLLFGKLSSTVTEGRVLITGIVPTADNRVDAVRLAWQVAGVREVINEIQVRDTVDPVTFGRDVLIANTLRTRLMFDSEVSAINYTVDVVEGVVYVMGISQTDVERDRVIGHARNIENVKRVVNYVILKNDPRRSATR
ncbi:MAG: BON domain-containing protein [Alphaproteobacteria bacterium]|nr:BON domain-containing protein [Alphaproteobacteria bacterium]